MRPEKYYLDVDLLRSTGNIIALRSLAVYQQKVGAWVLCCYKDMTCDEAIWKEQEERTRREMLQAWKQLQEDINERS